MRKKSQIVIATVPWVDTNSPIMAPAALKSCLQENNIQSYAFDLNAEVKQIVENHPHRDSILKFFLTEKVDQTAKKSIKDIIDFMVDQIISHNPEWVGLSLLTYLSQITNFWICARLRQRAPEIKIIIGGPGAFVTLKSGNSYVASLKSQNLIDYYISGDGESSMVALMQGQTDYPGINDVNWQQISNLNDLPIPNYDDYDWSLYKNKQIRLVGSRGCVRDCTFCDIHEHWDKFQYKSGEKIFSEINCLKSKYPVNVFSFSDSLVNGNQKEYRHLIARLADFNASQNSMKDRIRWTGSFIIRPMDQMKESDWKLTAESGAEILSVGVESFVEHIRYHIRKKFSNVDLEFALEMGAKYGIKMNLLLIVGYATETQKDFDAQLKWVEDHKRFAGNPVNLVQIGSGLGILPGTWLDRNKDVLKITLGNSEVLQDWSSELTGTTPKIRMEWHHQMYEKLKECKFTPNYMHDNHVLIESYINDKYQTGS